MPKVLRFFGRNEGLARDRWQQLLKNWKLEGKQKKKIRKKNNKQRIINEERWTKGEKILQLLIFLIMCWATLETYYMRTTAQQQNVKNTMPIIVFDAETPRKFSYSYPIIKNIGYGPAFNISVSKIKNLDLSIQFDSIVGLAQADEYKLSYEIYDSIPHPKWNVPNDSTDFYYFISYRGIGFKSQVPGKSLGDVEIHYEDITGKKYQVIQTIYYDWLKQKLFAKVKTYPNIEN